MLGFFFDKLKIFSKVIHFDVVDTGDDFDESRT